MTEQDIPKWWAQLLGEDHPAVKHYEQYLRDIDDPDDDYEYPPDSPDMIMAGVATMFIGTLPQKARAIIAQQLMNELIGLTNDPRLQLEQRHLARPDQEVA